MENLVGNARRRLEALFRLGVVGAALTACLKLSKDQPPLTPSPTPPEVTPTPTFIIPTETQTPTDTQTPTPIPTETPLPEVRLVLPREYDFSGCPWITDVQQLLEAARKTNYVFPPGTKPVGIYKIELLGSPWYEIITDGTNVEMLGCARMMYSGTQKRAEIDIVVIAVHTKEGTGFLNLYVASPDPDETAIWIEPVSKRMDAITNVNGEKLSLIFVMQRQDLGWGIFLKEDLPTNQPNLRPAMEESIKNQTIPPQLEELILSLRGVGTWS